jgi:hypothetical protein
VQVVEGLIDPVRKLESGDVGFRSLKKSLDTTAAGQADLPRLRGSGGVRAGDHPRENEAGLETARAHGRHRSKSRIASQQNPTF